MTSMPAASCRAMASFTAWSSMALKGAALSWPDSNCKKLLRSEEHTSELQSPCNLVCRLLLEKIRDTAHCDDFHLIPRNRRKHPHNFFCLAACAQGENHISVVDNAEIAVQRARRIEHNRQRSA